MIFKYFLYLFSKVARLFSSLVGTLLTLSVIITLGGVFGYYYILNSLPDVESLKTVQLQAPLRVLSKDGQLIAEFGTKKRIPITYDKIPKQLIEAVIATEDQRFFQHGGVDPLGLLRAAKNLVLTGRKEQGGSTITMQVARNFFLTRQKTYTRKLQEIVLAIKINEELSKEKIMELYLNKIYLGHRSYGVASAAQTYYGKPLNELTLAQLAMLAGLPKAPSSLNPLSNPVGAKERRNLVLSRMLEQGYIDEATYKKAINEPLNASYHGAITQVRAPYIAEMVRAELYAQMNEDAYTQGLSVYTTVDPDQQSAANKAVRDGLLAYSERHGYRAPQQNLGAYQTTKKTSWQATLKTMPAINGLQAAAVTRVADKSINALLANGDQIIIEWAGLAWAKPYTNGRWPGKQPKQAADIVRVGDVIRVTQETDKQWKLTQIPVAEAALAALNPNDGGITALVGGFAFDDSHFNRATQAERQPGSSFKPFIYSAALNEGYTLASVVNDAPIVLSNPGEADFWRPQNDTRRFYGPTRLRVGLKESRNLVTIRLLDSIGIDAAINYLSLFGFDPDKLPHSLSLALGAGSVTPLQMAAGFAIFANGGYQVKPYVINRIENLNREVIYQANVPQACWSADGENICPVDPQKVIAPQVITPQNAYFMTSALQDVIKYGTGRGAMVLGRNDLSGKTGTTNDQFDAWFVGYNRDVVVSTWVGFDQPQSLYEYGSKAALPIWIDFMRVALQGKPEHTQALPPDIVSVRIDQTTGLRTDATENSVFEFFRTTEVPEMDTEGSVSDSDSHLF